MAVKAHAPLAEKVLHAHRATAHPPHAEMAHRAHRALKLRAMADESNVAIPVLTTVGMAKAVLHHAVHALRDVVQVAAHRVEMAVAATGVVKVAAKTVAVTMATSCHATSTP